MRACRLRNLSRPEMHGRVIDNEARETVIIPRETISFYPVPSLEVRVCVSRVKGLTFLFVTYSLGPPARRTVHGTDHFYCMPKGSIQAMGQGHTICAP